ncbi:MazG nucleotide pyrophosphohydrolase domain-containing protein [Haloferax sp. S1W]|uniref:MazG nucleotide pyrophosphohydrolase domain-containing protein n=1 Tax=Haloferax sp. S1W TaxID=3377110 RepID=UPI0037C65222
MRDVSEFNAEHGLELSPELRMLDLTSEVGELSKEVIDAQDYGQTEFERTDDLVDEFGDVYYSLLSLAAELDIDAEAALAASLDKYQARMSASGDAGSGE